LRVNAALVETSGLLVEVLMSGRITGGDLYVIGKDEHHFRRH
jgi:hypothetical protein